MGPVFWKLDFRNVGYVQLQFVEVTHPARNFHCDDTNAWNDPCTVRVSSGGGADDACLLVDPAAYLSLSIIQHKSEIRVG